MCGSEGVFFMGVSRSVVTLNHARAAALSKSPSYSCECLQLGRSLRLSCGGADALFCGTRARLVDRGSTGLTGATEALVWESCRGGGMADTEDLKSSGAQAPCGFESRPRH